MPISRRPCRDPRPALARPARPLHRLGIDLPRHRRGGRHDPAVPHGGDPLRPRRARAPDLLGRAGPRLVRDAQPSRVARQRDRGRAAPWRRDGHGRVGRADDPVRNCRADHRVDAGLGRDLRSRPVRGAAPGDRDRRHRRRVRRRGDPGRPDDRRRDGRARSARSRGTAHLADLVDVGLALCQPSGHAPESATGCDGAPDAVRGGRPVGHGAAQRRAGALRSRRHLEGVAVWPSRTSP